MMTIPCHPVTSGGVALDLSPHAFGEMRASNDFADDPLALRVRMSEDGYLLLRDFFPREEIMQARLKIAEALDRIGVVDPNRPLLDIGAIPGRVENFRPDIANSTPELNTVIYSDRIMEFFTNFLGGEATHFDYTWLRTIAPGHGTSPHCDVVYMGRGTRKLYTSWTPLGDIDLTLGGLIVLEGSHNKIELLGRYSQMDVDTACVNADGKSQLNVAGFNGFGAITYDARDLREQFGLRWVTTEFNAGDLLIFSIFTVHASLDNHSDRLRVSSDSRYQLKSEPLDERWIGENPPAHGGKMVKQMIC